MHKLRKRPLCYFWSEDISQLSGRKFTLITNHKPLLAILGPKSAFPTQGPLRIQWWAFILMAYDYEMEYRQAADHANAEALSRLPSKVEGGTAEEGKFFYFSMMEDLPVKANYIAHNTNKDPVPSRVRELTLNGCQVM